VDGKIGDFRAIFDGNGRLSRKRCENPGFKVTVYLEVEYLKNGAF